MTEAYTTVFNRFDNGFDVHSYSKSLGRVFNPETEIVSMGISATIPQPMSANAPKFSR